MNAASAGAQIIHNLRRSRQGSALRNGFRYVNGDIVVILDGDGQHAPSEIPKLLEPVLSQRADLVIGSRYLDYDFSGFGVARRLSEIILTRIMRAIVGLPLTDTQSGFRCIATNALAALNLTAGYSITAEMPIQAIGQMTEATA
jgi:glycosyltransferase involved in cell wall biosynthesis